MKTNDTYRAMSGDVLASSRNYNLDLIKIIACVAVVGLHTLKKDLSVFNSTLYDCCGFAVPVFFMSSGYILLNRSGVTISYVIKKILRILHVVLLWSFLIFGVKLCSNIAKGQFEPAFLLELPIIAVKSILKKAPLWQFWYLGSLMILYILLPLLQKLEQKVKYIWAVCLVVGLGFQIASYACGEPIQKHFIQTFRMWTWVQYFVLGSLLARNEPNRWNVSIRLHGNILIALTCFVLVYQNIMGRFVLNNMYAEYFYDDILTVIWVGILFKFVMRLNLTDRSVAAIKQLAPITMGVYITHPLFVKLGNRIFEIDTIPASLLYFACILVLSAAVSFCMKHIPGVKRLIEI